MDVNPVFLYLLQINKTTLGQPRLILNRAPQAVTPLSWATGVCSPDSPIEAPEPQRGEDSSGASASEISGICPPAPLLTTTNLARATIISHVFYYDNPSEVSSSLPTPSFLKKRFYLFIFRERGRERETSMRGCLLRALYWAPGLQHQACAVDPEWNQRPF